MDSETWREECKRIDAPYMEQMKRINALALDFPGEKIVDARARYTTNKFIREEKERIKNKEEKNRPSREDSLRVNAMNLDAGKKDDDFKEEEKQRKTRAHKQRQTRADTQFWALHEAMKAKQKKQNENLEEKGDKEDQEVCGKRAR